MIDRKIICKSVPETVASRPSPDVCSREGDQHQDCACGTVISGNRATSTSATTPPIGACSPGAPTTASWRRRGWSGWRSTCRATPAGRRTPSTARRRSVSGSQPAMQRGYLPSCRNVFGTQLAMQRPAVTFPAAEVSLGPHPVAPLHAVLRHGRHAAAVRHHCPVLLSVCSSVCLSRTYIHTYKLI